MLRQTVSLAAVRGSLVLFAALLPAQLLSADSLEAEKLSNPTLVKKSHTQAYHLAKDPDGNVLPVPDFSRPIGSLVTLESQSEPRWTPANQ